MSKLSEDEAIEKLKQLVIRCKECKFATCENCEINWNEVQAIETILDLYNNTKYELKGKEALVDTMSHNEEVLIRNYEILEKKLQQEREKNKTLEDGDMTQMYVNGYYDGEDKLKSKIREVLEKYKYTEVVDTMKIIDFYKAIQELLKEE